MSVMRWIVDKFFNKSYDVFYFIIFCYFVICSVLLYVLYFFELMYSGFFLCLFVLISVPFYIMYLYGWFIINWLNFTYIELINYNGWSRQYDEMFWDLGSNWASFFFLKPKNWGFFTIDWFSDYVGLFGPIWWSFYLLFFWFILNFYTYPVVFYFFFLFCINIFNCFFFFYFLSLYGILVLLFISVLLFFLVLILYSQQVVYDGVVFYILLGNWFSFGGRSLVSFELLLDRISFFFCFVVCLIAVFTLIYSFVYFRYEPLIGRFVFLLGSFVCSMSLLVLSGNLLVLFLGWELIGFTSFLLISFWTTRVGTFRSGFKAFVFNKFSDFCIFIAIILLYKIYGTTNFLTMVANTTALKNQFIITQFLSIQVSEFICIFLLGAAFVKSAQIGGHVWLPDSMEAPVPASALIHSATLVSAGIFLLLRFLFLISNTTYVFYLGLGVGCFTAFFGAVCASTQIDIKRLLAYSTISHCGFLVFLVFCFNVNYVLLYLLIHGFVKAGSFFLVGNVIRFSQNNQDIRKMGGLFFYMPIESILLFFFLGMLAGLPFFIGYYNKHFILFMFFNNVFSSCFFLVFCFFGACLGIFYSFRCFFFVFFNIALGHTHTKNTLSLYTNNTTLAMLFSSLGLYICGLTSSFLFYKYTHYTLYTTQTPTIIQDLYIINENLLFYNIFYLIFFNLIFIFFSLFFIYTNWRRTSLSIFSYSRLVFFFVFFFVFFLFK